MGFGDAVESAGPYANNTAPCSRQMTTPTLSFTGRMLFLTPNQQCQSTWTVLKNCDDWCVVCAWQEYCLKFIIKESNYNQIVMSREFETIEQPLMVEIIRRRQMPHRRPLSEPLPQFDILNCTKPALTYFFILCWMSVVWVINLRPATHVWYSLLSVITGEKWPAHTVTQNVYCGLYQSLFF